MAGGNLKNKMRFWKAQPIEKSREMKLAAQKAIAEARAKQEAREVMAAAKKSHAEWLETIAKGLDKPLEQPAEKPVEPQPEPAPTPAPEPDPVEEQPTITQPERFAHIFVAVCKEFGVNPADVRSKLRHPRIVAARMVIIHLARKNTLLSYPDIQVLMGTSTTSHSTAITAHQRLERNIDLPMFAGESKTFRQVIDRFNAAEFCFVA